MRHSRIVLFAIGLAAVDIFHSQGASADSSGETVPLSSIERLGKSLFEDAELSVGRNQSCASCHALDTGFTGPDSDINKSGSVMEGSIAGRFGNTKPPSAAYASQAPVLFHKYDDGSLLFVGGNFGNGRASGKRLGNPVADQAMMPFLNPLEMALPHEICVVKRVCQPRNPGQYPVKLTDVWGKSVCAIEFPAEIDNQCGDPAAKITLPQRLHEKVEHSYDKIALSIAAYEASKEVNPFSSKFDAYLAGKATLSEQEQLGMKLFQGKGLCANCHLLTRGPNGEPPLLTDYTYDNLGVPRNPANPFYHAPAFNSQRENWVEKGLQAFLAKDPLYKSVAASQLGKVKVPTLRNVDRRPSPGFTKAFMHNGYFKSLKGVVHFYNTRDKKPRCKQRFTPEAMALKLGCWPEPEVAANVNTEELGKLGLTDAEENAIVAFMKTLNDGYTAANTTPKVAQ